MPGRAADSSLQNSQNPTVHGPTAAVGVLFTASSSPVAYDDADLVVQPLPTGARKVVQRGGYYGRYLSSRHPVYLHDGSFFAVPFDLSRLEVTGQPVLALDSVRSNPVCGGAAFCRVLIGHGVVRAGAEL